MADPSPPTAHFFVTAQPWMQEDSSCKNMPTEMFFPENQTGTLKAKAVCALCPVRKPCAEQAFIEEGSAPYGRYGIRGWMTPAQRDVVYRRGGLRGRDPKRLLLGRDGRRKIRPVPDEGLDWSRHHTTLARKMCVWMEGRLNVGQRVPSVTKLCQLLSCNPVPLAKVLEELVEVGVLDQVGRVYTYRGNQVGLLKPRRGATEPMARGDSRA
jgi:hypothetical protein